MKPLLMALTLDHLLDDLVGTWCECGRRDMFSFSDAGDDVDLVDLVDGEGLRGARLLLDDVDRSAGVLSPSLSALQSGSNLEGSSFLTVPASVMKSPATRLECELFPRVGSS